MIYPTNPKDEFSTEENCFIIEILNNEKSPNLSIARARVEPGVTTQLHRVNGTEEFYYILEGTGVVELDGTFSKDVGVGDVVHIEAGQPQRITNTSDSDLIFLCVCTPRFRQGAYDSLG